LEEAYEGQIAFDDQANIPYQTVPRQGIRFGRKGPVQNNQAQGNRGGTKHRDPGSTVV
jgi:hypothetical protein